MYKWIQNYALNHGKIVEVLNLIIMSIVQRTKLFRSRAAILDSVYQLSTPISPEDLSSINACMLASLMLIDQLIKIKTVDVSMKFYKRDS